MSDLTRFRDYARMKSTDPQGPTYEHWLWRQLADEIDTYLADPTPDPGVDLWGNPGVEPTEKEETRE